MIYFKTIYEKCLFQKFVGAYKFLKKSKNLFLPVWNLVKDGNGKMDVTKPFVSVYYEKFTRLLSR